MKRWLLYHALTVLDVIRLWSTVQHHVVIVAGICLPILILLGLKNGHVADLREDLLKSPTGRQVVFWSGQQGELMTVDRIHAYEQEIPGVEVVIPEIQKLVAISARPGCGHASRGPGHALLDPHGGSDSRTVRRGCARRETAPASCWSRVWPRHSMFIWAMRCR